VRKKGVRTFYRGGFCSREVNNFPGKRAAVVEGVQRLWSGKGVRMGGDPVRSE